MTPNKKLRDGCTKLSLSLSEEQFVKLETYIEEILAFNKTYNLMKADSADELAVNHILDSLAAHAHIKQLIESKPEDAVVADIGSGGGCPGIPLAIAFPNTKFVLVERMEKRCAFLERMVKKLSLTNTKVQCTAAIDVAPESFDVEVFRAFHPFDKKIVQLLFKLLKPNGTIAAYKARSEKISEEMQAVSHLIPSYKKIPLTVPFLEDHERNLVVIHK
ncbi:MAG: 16S rRNA (guanine(527)-N(7))-methyltransferase RsmG [Treponema sp.]|nr:16S rRNA (guanine(527)-N(7))-methyltransferase RsmG [Treponema sp.]